jgi:hypothetical protein
VGGEAPPPRSASARYSFIVLGLPGVLAGPPGVPRSVGVMMESAATDEGIEPSISTHETPARPPETPETPLPITSSVASKHSKHSKQSKGALRHVRLMDDGIEVGTAGTPERSPNRRISVKLHSRGASIASSVANLANTNMGVGMLALPSAFAAAGWLGGAVMLILSAVIATFGSHLLAECVDRVGRPAPLPKVTEVALGRFGILMTNFSVIIIGSSCAIGYLIVVGDTLPEIFRFVTGADEGHSGSVFEARQFWILFALLVIVPLGFLRKIESLGFASLLVVGCVGIIVATVFLFAIGPSATFDPCGSQEGQQAEEAAGGEEAPRTTCRGTVVATRDAQHTLSALPTCLFAFAAQINVPSIVSELRHPTRRRVWKTLIGGGTRDRPACDRPACLASFHPARTAIA